MTDDEVPKNRLLRDLERGGAPKLLFDAVLPRSSCLPRPSPKDRTRVRPYAAACSAQKTPRSTPAIAGSSLLERRVERAGLFPREDVERAHQASDAHGLCAQHAQLDDLFLAEVLAQALVDRVGVDGIVARLEE